MNWTIVPILLTLAEFGSILVGCLEIKQGRFHMGFILCQAGGILGYLEGRTYPHGIWLQ